MSNLPTPPPYFSRKKSQILEKLSVPVLEYTDLSPKGSVDEGIRELIDEINACDGLVTTSSCAGRVSVFLEGHKAPRANPGSLGREDTATEPARKPTSARIGGKGGGGTWLFVSHDPLDESTQDWVSVLGLTLVEAQGDPQEREAEIGGGNEPRCIHFKFEPMILHVLTASPEHGQSLLQCGLQAAFRESGAINLTRHAQLEPPTPMVAIRTTGLAFESLIGMQMDGVNRCIVSRDYLQTLVRIANERFAENFKRMEAFRIVLRDFGRIGRGSGGGGEWEDSAARRERMRSEGLRRSAQLKKDTIPAAPSLE